MMNMQTGESNMQEIGKDVSHQVLPFNDTMIIFVLGGPGSGKGTQCAVLAKTFQLAHISVGDLLREEVAQGSKLGAEITAAMREGKMVSMAITKQLLVNAISKVKDHSIGILLDGFPRELAQAREFELSIGHCSFLLNFDCSKDLLVKRLLKRGETSGREDDNAETIAKRLDTFEQLTRPVIEHYARLDRVCTVSTFIL
ncbi:adenylate kinase-domain-containing protein [Syncephalis fuscata]|nr:adenylate kinase-domain-containing protein [Syncephalis fuscata]